MQAGFGNRHLTALSSFQHQDNTFLDIMDLMIGKLSSNEDDQGYEKVNQKYNLALLQGCRDYSVQKLYRNYENVVPNELIWFESPP